MNKKTDIILKILNEADLIGIAIYDDSGMEYLKESKEICDLINLENEISVEKICSILEKAFSKNFQTGIDNNGERVTDLSFDIGTKEQHLDIAKKIFNEIKYMQEIQNTDKVQIHPLLQKIADLFPDSKNKFIEYYEDYYTPMGFIESVTITLLQDSKFDVVIWTNFLNEIYDPKNEEIHWGVNYSLEVLYLNKNYSDYLKANLRPELKKIYEYWEEYYKYG